MLYFLSSNYAERPGFEPGNRFGRLHAFQACLFSHSSISPSTCAHHGDFFEIGCKLRLFYDIAAKSATKILIFSE